MCGRFYIAEEDTAEDLLRIIDALNRRYKGITPVKTQGEIRPTDIIPVMANSPSNLVREGHFKTVRIGTAIRISRKSFDEWLEAQTN